MMNLNMHMESFEFSDDIIQQDDSIYIIVTTLPDEQRKRFNTNSKKIEEAHPDFNFEISHLTKKIIVIFRSKSNIKKDNIFASTIIRSDQFPKNTNDKNNTEVKNILIYEPFPNDFNTNNSVLENRKIIGKMEVKFSLDKMLKSKNNTDKHKN